SRRRAVGADPALATLATAAATLLRDAARVRQEGHLTGVLDRHGDRGLLLGVVAGDPTSADLGAVGHEAAQEVHVLVVDVLDRLLREDADLLLGATRVVLVLGALGLGCHQNGSSSA